MTFPNIYRSVTELGSGGYIKIKGCRYIFKVTCKVTRRCSSKTLDEIQQ